jgi:hypothetical protein
MNRYVAIVVAVSFLSMADGVRAETLGEGDTCVVTVKEAALQKGKVMLAPVTCGTKVKVQRVRGEWVRTAIQHEGKTVEGWIERQNLALCASVNDTKQRFSDNYETLAKAVAVLDLVERPKRWGTTEEDTAKKLADLREQVDELKKIAETDSGDIKVLAQHIRDEMVFVQKLVRAISEHPDYAGLARDKANGVSAELTPAPKVEIESKEIPPNESLSGLRARYYHCIDEARGLALSLTKQAKKLSGPKVERGRALVIDFTKPYPFEADQGVPEQPSSKDPFDNPDRIALTNCCDSDLTRCTVLVEVIGENDTRYNMHYVSRWKKGQKLQALYYGGVKSGEKTLFRFSAMNVKQVKVSIFCDQLTQEGIEYNYNSSEKETAFRHYVESMVIVGKCEPFSISFGSGYKVDILLKEGKLLPKGKLVARIYREDIRAWQEKEITFSDWKGGELRSVRLADEKGVAEGSIGQYQVILEVTYKEWSHKRQWVWDYP